MLECRIVHSNLKNSFAFQVIILTCQQQNRQQVVLKIAVKFFHLLFSEKRISIPNFDEMIGELESTQELKQLEWKIPNYVSLRVGTYKSPSFTFANHSWHLTISAELYTVHKYLTVILKCENDSHCTDVMYSFSIKKSDGTLTTTKTYQSSMVSEWPFLPLDEISLLPSGIITIVCNLKYGLDLNGGDAIASAQKETSLNENSAVETLEHVILAGIMNNLNF